MNNMIKSIRVDAVCKNCKTIIKNLFVEDKQGNPSFVDIPCNNCCKKNTLYLLPEQDEENEQKNKKSKKI